MEMRINYLEFVTKHGAREVSEGKWEFDATASPYYAKVEAKGFNRELHRLMMSPLLEIKEVFETVRNDRVTKSDESLMCEAIRSLLNFESLIDADVHFIPYSPDELDELAGRAERILSLYNDLIDSGVFRQSGLHGIGVSKLTDEIAKIREVYDRTATASGMSLTTAVKWQHLDSFYRLVVDAFKRCVA